MTTGMRTNSPPLRNSFRAATNCALGCREVKNSDSDVSSKTLCGGKVAGVGVVLDRAESANILPDKGVALQKDGYERCLLDQPLRIANNVPACPEINFVWRAGIELWVEASAQYASVRVRQVALQITASDLSVNLRSGVLVSDVKGHLEPPNELRLSTAHRCLQDALDSYAADKPC